MKHVFSTYISSVEYPTAVDLVARKKVDVTSLVTHKFRIVDFEKALEIADDFKQKPVKVIVTV